MGVIRIYSKPVVPGSSTIELYESDGITFSWNLRRWQSFTGVGFGDYIVRVTDVYLRLRFNW